MQNAPNRLRLTKAEQTELRRLERSIAQLKKSRVVIMRRSYARTAHWEKARG